MIEQKYQKQTTVRSIELSETRKRYEVEENLQNLKLGIVVPAVFIRETIDLLNQSEQTK